MLDSIYHKALKLFLNDVFGGKRLETLFHYVSGKSVNHKWFIDFIAWRYFTPMIISVHSSFVNISLWSGELVALL